MEYSTRTLTPSASTSSLHERNNHSARTLTPSASADSLHKSGSQRKLINAQLREGILNLSAHNLSSLNGPTHPSTLGQSISLTSLVSVGSDASAPPPVAPPRSAQLNTGEVLQPYQPSHLQAGGASFAVPATVATQVQHPAQSAPPSQHTPPVWQTLQGSRNPSTSSLPRNPHHPPAMSAPSMAVVHPQSAISGAREALQPAPVQAVAAQQQTPQQSEAAGMTQSTWVIEEVIDFGVPLDEGMVRECDDAGYPLGCKSLAVGASPRSHGTMFDGCVRAVCYDEEQVMAMHSQRQEGKDFC